MISENCGNISVALPIWAGEPDIPQVNGPLTVQQSHVAEYEVLNHSIGSTYQWSYPQGWTYNTYIDGPWSWGKPVVNAQNGSIFVNAINPCGNNDINFQVSVDSGGGGVPKTPINDKFIAHPNPSSHILTIEAKEIASHNNSNPNGDKEIKYELFDFNYVLKTTGNFKSKIDLDLSDYNKGQYILRITFEKKSETHHIIIN
jgi:hypothetical protein